jgi:phosphate/sulfate permease
MLPKGGNSVCVAASSLIQPIVAFTLAYFVYRLGLSAYRKQKEHELVRARYLDTGVDRVAANIEYALAVLRHNEAHALHVLKVFRDVGPDEAASLCKPDSFLRLENNRMEVGAAHRLRALIGTPVFWGLLQSLFIDAQAGSSFYQHAGAIIRIAQADPTKFADRAALVENFLAESEGWSKKANHYYLALAALHTLARIFERERFTLEDLDGFKEKAEVKDLIAKMDTFLKNTQQS